MPLSRRRHADADAIIFIADATPLLRQADLRAAAAAAYCFSLAITLSCHYAAIAI